MKKKKKNVPSSFLILHLLGVDMVCDSSLNSISIQTKANRNYSATSEDVMNQKCCFATNWKQSFGEFSQWRYCTKWGNTLAIDIAEKLRTYTRSKCRQDTPSLSQEKHTLVLFRCIFRKKKTWTHFVGNSLVKATSSSVVIVLRTFAMIHWSWHITWLLCIRRV